MKKIFYLITIIVLIISCSKSSNNYGDYVGNAIIDSTGNSIVIEQYELFQSCINAAGYWEIHPTCPKYEILGIEIDVEDRFDHEIFIQCDSNLLSIDFGSGQSAFAEIDVNGSMIVPDQEISLDFTKETGEFYDVNVNGSGDIYPGGIGQLNLTFVFEIIPNTNAFDSTSCILILEKLDFP